MAEKPCNVPRDMSGICAKAHSCGNPAPPLGGELAGLAGNQFCDERLAAYLVIYLFTYL